MGAGAGAGAGARRRREVVQYSSAAKEAAVGATQGDRCGCGLATFHG